MSDFSQFLERLGLLHDCAVTMFEWRPEQKKLVFAIEDFYWNFEALPQYPGPKSGLISLEDVRRVEIIIENNDEPLRIYEFEIVEESADTSTVSVTFSPAGRIVVVYGRAVLPDIPLP